MLNKATLIGNLGKDPEIRYTQDGKPVANFSLATSESWKDQQGNWQSKSEWHNVVAFGKLAEVIGNNLKKGSKVYLEGKIQTRKWQDQSGQDRYSTEIILDFNGVIKFLDKKENDSSNQHQKPQNNQQPQQQNDYPTFDDMEDSIPF